MPVSKSSRKKKTTKTARTGRLRVERKKELLTAVNDSALQCYNLVSRVEELVGSMQDISNVTQIPKDVEDLWAVVSRDTQQMAAKLRSIDNDRPTKLGNDDSANLMTCMSLATRYEDWINEFVEVIVPNSGRLTAHLTHLVESAKQEKKVATADQLSNESTDTEKE